MEQRGFVVLTLAFRNEEGCWTAECLELGTATFGDTLEEAKELILEAVELHIATLDDVGELKRFFQKHKIQIHPAKPSSQEAFRVPLKEDTYYKPIIQEVFQHVDQRSLRVAGA